ncbi:cytochrome P450 [Favolaschia claudopus]|uniref:Cytochrome P450 n=1 Tax=Favolaschia claudopus TaxID=2862362 RepID=A0AAW0AIM0_9AGAR
MTWSSGSMFSFKILSENVIVVRGLAGRNVFLSKGLDFLAGYKLLMPQIKEFLPLTPLSGDESWGAVVASFIRTRMIEKFHSTMLGAVATSYAAWGDNGTLGLFQSVNQIVFRVSLPLAGCQLLAEDARTVEALVDIFSRLEEGSQPSSLIFPWIPTPTRIRRVLAGAQLYRMTKRVVEERERLGLEVDDSLQTLIRHKYPMSEIARFIATILFASVTNTANLFAWTLVYLEVYKPWKARVAAEVENFLWDSNIIVSRNLFDDIANVPLSSMDEKLPTIELITYEVLRLHARGPFIRRNIGGDSTVDGADLPNGSFIMFPAEDLHWNPELFPDPEVFDPTRFTAENIEQRKKFGVSYIGWGAGRHQCVGKRTALLEIKMMIVLLMAKYDFQITDTANRPLSAVPAVYTKQLFKVCGPQEAVNIEYRIKSGC